MGEHPRIRRRLTTPLCMTLYKLYSAILTVAATVLGKQDPPLTSMANQNELAKAKADRPATNKKKLRQSIEENLSNLLQHALSGKMAYLQRSFHRFAAVAFISPGQAANNQPRKP